MALLVLIGPARADNESDEFLKEVAVATKALKTLSADVTLKQSDSGPVTTTTGVVRLKKPNLAYFELGKPLRQTIASDGKSIWLVEQDRNRYQKKDANSDGNQVASFTMVPVGMFFDPDFRGFLEPSIKATRFIGSETINVTTYRVVEITGDKPYEFTLKCFVAKNKLVLRTELRLKLGDKTITFGCALANVKVNEPLADDSFAYALPKGTARYDSSDTTGQLIPLGEKAYRFTFPTPDGQNLSLDSLLKVKKAILVNFWFHACEPCRKELPIVQ
ncbi:MAG: hypothetical protein KatS3mg114_0148 [Planctomycetaceae bacterium]|nr:MAG: hypothetical protein KatS3mg114_0148 [Planctomycetaceae bacterium]